MTKTPFTDECPDLVSLEKEGEGALSGLSCPSQAFFWNPDKDITDSGVEPKYPLSKDSEEFKAWTIYWESAIPILSPIRMGRGRL